MSLMKNMNKLSLIKSINNRMHMNSINRLSLVKNIIELSIINCSTLILLTKSVHCSIHSF
jgi:hypothetical protein